jgi:hypothetical protein
LTPAYKGRLPEVKQQVLEMSLKGSGVRDTARVLQISPTTVIERPVPTSTRPWLKMSSVATRSAMRTGWL